MGRKATRLWIIFAAMSVPPVVAPARTTSPRPTPSSTPPNTEASITLPETSRTGTRSMNSDINDIAMNERTAKRQPTVRQPIRNSGTFSTKLIRPTDSGSTLASTVEMPEMPPGAMS